MQSVWAFVQLEISFYFVSKFYSELNTLMLVLFAESFDLELCLQNTIKCYIV